MKQKTKSITYYLAPASFNKIIDFQVRKRFKFHSVGRPVKCKILIKKWRYKEDKRRKGLLNLSNPEIRNRYREELTLILCESEPKEATDAEEYYNLLENKIQKAVENTKASLHTEEE